MRSHSRVANAQQNARNLLLVDVSHDAEVRLHAFSFKLIDGIVVIPVVFPRLLSFTEVLVDGVVDNPVGLPRRWFFMAQFIVRIVDIHILLPRHGSSTVPFIDKSVTYQSGWRSSDRSR